MLIYGSSKVLAVHLRRRPDVPDPDGAVQARGGQQILVEVLGVYMYVYIYIYTHTPELWCGPLWR